MEPLHPPESHCLETGGMRRVHLRGRANILERTCVHVAGFNLSLVMRQPIGFGAPRGLGGRPVAIWALLRLWTTWLASVLGIGKSIGRSDRVVDFDVIRRRASHGSVGFSAGC
jgi:hypothetical protein